MASVEQLPSGKWRGIYRDALGRKRHTPAAVSKTAARRAASVAEDAAARGQRTDPHGGRMRWGSWCEQWWSGRQVEDSTRQTDRSNINRRLRPRWGDVALNQITRLELQRWVLDLEKAMGPSGVRQNFYLLSASLGSAVDEGLIGVNPCTSTRITLPPLPDATERFLTEQESDRILYYLDGPFRMLAEVLLGTGMRVGEACGLHWHRVDLDAGTVQVKETWNLVGRSVKPYPKGKRRRTVPLTPELTEQLVRWRDANPPSKVCGRPHEKDPLERSGCRSGLVLTGERGAPLDHNNFSKREWAWAVDMAEVGRVRVHDLRHTYASRLVTRGVSLERVQKLLGHASIVTTQRYAHLITDGFDEVRAALAGGTDRGTGVAVPMMGERPAYRRPRAV